MRIVVFLLAALCSSAALAAGPAEEDLSSYNAAVAMSQGDHGTALRVLAEQGNTKAQDWLGYMYEGGSGVPQDYVEAVKWYRMAAEKNLGQAQHDLARMYAEGKGVTKDAVQAHMWANLAASHPSQDQLFDRWESWASFRFRLAAQMTPAQIAEAQRLAREWRPK
jgi:TPR repeat protein